MTLSCVAKINSYQMIEGWKLQYVADSTIIKTTDKATFNKNDSAIAHQAGFNNSNLKTEQLTLSLIKDKKTLDSILLKSQEEKEIILTEASKILRDEIHSITDNKHKNFIQDDFNNVFPIIDFMLAIDAKNGHAIYFKGEIYRLLNNYDQFLKYFQLYLNIEDSIGSCSEKVTNARLCYETPHGYCEQRTAWISQLLANYYYKKGIGMSDLNKKLK